MLYLIIGMSFSEHLAHRSRPQCRLQNTTTCNKSVFLIFFISSIYICTVSAKWLTSLLILVSFFDDLHSLIVLLASHSLADRLLGLTNSVCLSVTVGEHMVRPTKTIWDVVGKPNILVSVTPKSPIFGLMGISNDQTKACTWGLCHSALITSVVV